MSEDEFRRVVWPSLPASRPDRNVPWEFAWENLNSRSEAHLRALENGWEGGERTVAAVTFLGETTDYGRFRVHRRAEVTLRDAAGIETTTRLCGSLIEMGGRYKVFSYVID